MSFVRVEFIGGPIDGELMVLDSPPPDIRIPYNQGVGASFREALYRARLPVDHEERLLRDKMNVKVPYEFVR